MGAGSRRAETGSQPHPLAATPEAKTYILPPTRTKRSPLQIMEQFPAPRKPCEYQLLFPVLTERLEAAAVAL